MTINELLVALRQPIPEVYLSIKTSDRERIAYLPWYKATLLADDRLGGAWSHELVEHWIDNAARGSKNKGYVSTALAHCRVRVTIHGSDRDISREAIGVDDERRPCTVCGAEFTCNKYVKRRTCGNACRKKAIGESRRGLRTAG
jgi:hypothetical protein